MTYFYFLFLFIHCRLMLFLFYNIINLKFYFFQNRSNQFNPNLKKLDRIGSDLKSKLNQFNPNRFKLYYLDLINFLLKTNPNRTTNTPNL